MTTRAKTILDMMLEAATSAYENHERELMYAMPGNAEVAARARLEAASAMRDAIKRYALVVPGYVHQEDEPPEA